MAVVLDASAVLALSFDEPGAAKVRERIHGGLLGTTNLAEISQPSQHLGMLMSGVGVHGGVDHLASRAGSQHHGQAEDAPSD